MAQHLLLVEDEEALRNSLADYLVSQGYLLTLAGSEDEALSLAELNPPDLVLTDLMLQNGSGLSLLKRLKASVPPESAPHCILMTAYGTLDSAVEALRDRVDDFLTKPFSLKDLQRALDARREIPRDSEENGRRLATLALARLRHELAAPAARLLAYVDMLDQGLFGPLGTVQEAKVKAMQLCLRRMAMAVDSARVLRPDLYPRPRLERLRPDSMLKVALSDFDLDFERLGAGVVQCVQEDLPGVLADRRAAGLALEFMLGALLLRLDTGSTVRMVWEPGPDSLSLRLLTDPAPQKADLPLPELDPLLLEQSGMSLGPVREDGSMTLRFLRLEPHAGPA